MRWGASRFSGAVGQNKQRWSFGYFNTAIHGHCCQIAFEILLSRINDTSFSISRCLQGQWFASSTTTYHMAPICVTLCVVFEPFPRTLSNNIGYGSVSIHPISVSALGWGFENFVIRKTPQQCNDYDLDIDYTILRTYYKLCCHFRREDIFVVQLISWCW